MKNGKESANSILVRQASRSDIEEIGELVKKTELFPKEMLGEMIAPFLQDTMGEERWLVAESEERVLGFSYYRKEMLTHSTWNVLALAVGTETQGSGVGKLLMSKVEEELKRESQSVLIVETSGLEEFESTRMFYEKIGYEREATIRDFFEPGDDKVVYWKRLMG